jgi:hypothetical protein
MSDTEKVNFVKVDDIKILHIDRHMPVTVNAGSFIFGAFVLVILFISLLGDDKVRDLTPEDTTEEEPRVVAPAQAPARQQVKPLTYDQKRYKDYIEKY